MCSLASLRLMLQVGSRSTCRHYGMSHFYPIVARTSSSSLLKCPPPSSSLVQQKTQLSLSPAKKTAEIEQDGHDHVMHWNAERILTVLLLGSLPIAVFAPSPSIEYFLSLALTVHSHWGVEAAVVDYIRPAMFGKVIPKLAVGAVYALSFFTLGGLCYFIYSDVGIVNAVKMLWKL